MQKIWYLELFYLQIHSLPRRTPQRAGRLSTFKCTFLKTAFFNSASSGTRIIFIRSTWNFKFQNFNYLQKYKFFFQYVKNCLSYEAFFTIFYENKKKYVAVFEKGYVFICILLYRKWRNLFFFLFQIQNFALMLLAAEPFDKNGFLQAGITHNTLHIGVIP